VNRLAPDSKITLTEKFALYRSFNFVTWLNSPNVDCWGKLDQL